MSSTDLSSGSSGSGAQLGSSEPEDIDTSNGTGPSSAYNITKLSEKNYGVWKVRMKAILSDRKLAGVVFGTEEKPKDPKALKLWQRKDEQALTQITLAVDDEQTDHVQDATTAKEAWDILSVMHRPQGLSASTHLRGQFFSTYWKPGTSIRAHIAVLKDLRSQLREVGNPISDQDMASTLLHSVSGPYESLVGEIEGADSSVMVTSKYVESRLLGREARLKQLAERDVTVPAVETVLVSGSSGGVGSGTAPSARGPVNCVHCGKRGHTKANCWELIGVPPGWVPKGKRPSGRKANVAVANSQVNMLIATIEESQEQGTGGCAALVNSIRSPTPSGRSPPKTWISDSGATKHISPNRSWFRNYTPIPSVKVSLGDGHVFEAIGKGDILVEAVVEGKPVRSLLREVLYAPDSHYNLLSVSRLTSVGVTVIYSGDQAVMRSERNSVLFLGKRGRDGLYHVSMETMQDEPAGAINGPHY